jgi:hypothetical protein
MNNKYCLMCENEEIILQEETFTYWASSDMLKVRSNFSFEKKLREPIRGKSVDYTVNFVIDFNCNKYIGISYIFDLKFILINEDRPSFPTEEEVKLYVSGRYAYLCINAMVALAKERIKTREELDKAMKFFKRFINEDR